MSKKKSKAVVVTGPPKPSDILAGASKDVEKVLQVPRHEASSTKAGPLTGSIVAVRVHGSIKVFQVHRGIFDGSGVLSKGEVGQQHDVVIRDVTVSAFELILRFLYAQYLDHEVALLPISDSKPDVGRELKLACEIYCFAVNQRLPKLKAEATNHIQRLWCADIDSVVAAAVHVYAHVTVAESWFAAMVRQRFKEALDDPHFLYQSHTTRIFGGGIGMLLFDCLREQYSALTLSLENSTSDTIPKVPDESCEPLLYPAVDGNNNGEEAERDRPSADWVDVYEPTEVDAISLAATSHSDSTTMASVSSGPDSGSHSLTLSSSNTNQQFNEVSNQVSYVPPDVGSGDSPQDEDPPQTLVGSHENAPVSSSQEGNVAAANLPLAQSGEGVLCASRSLHLQNRLDWLGCAVCAAEVCRAVAELTR